LFFQDVHDGRGIQAAGTSKKDGALQKADIGIGVQPVAAFGALRNDQAERFPGAQGRGGDANALGDFADA